MFDRQLDLNSMMVAITGLHSVAVGAALVLSHADRPEITHNVNEAIFWILSVL